MTTPQKSVSASGVRGDGGDRAATYGRGDYATGVNLGDRERLVSAIGGGALTVIGLTRVLSRGSLGGLGVALLGGALVYRGLSGFCHLYGALGIDRASHGTVTGNRGVKVERTITVNATAEQLFRVWRNLENLPRFMSHLERVTVTGGNHSRWTVRAPAGMKIEWEAEIINEKPNELIAWQSIGNPIVDSAGSVRFERAADGQGTHVHVSLQYDPPGGEVGHALAALFGADAGGQIEADLGNFKRAMEAGELAA